MPETLTKRAPLYTNRLCVKKRMLISAHAMPLLYLKSHHLCTCFSPATSSQSIFPRPSIYARNTLSRPLRPRHLVPRLMRTLGRLLQRLDLARGFAHRSEAAAVLANEVIWIAVLDDSALVKH